ncbi:hypothetical protein JOY44_18285 [Phormidium sp. CLA17]|uniref:hypothetical protein n=1 Tax=Leptolyngbya sp. Cla-17 TaxID=2803751 RepID=UPI00149143E4|nr:hypothetical protein [Leptolyngbya sp. Cla-17]MBM0743537.1 hypothetical protein [Leptolyngbya sp. Cla-17]
MPKVLKSNFFWLVFSVSLTLFSFHLFFAWGLMVGTLYSLFFLFRFTRLESALSNREHQFYLTAILLYPPAETLVQWFGINGFIPRDFTLINRLEHFCWATVLVLFFLPFLSGVWRRLNRFQNLVFVVGFTCLLGNINEFLEFFLRIQDSPIDQARFAAFYSDTIYDMMMNLFGSIAGFAILYSLQPKSSELNSVHPR